MCLQSESWQVVLVLYLRPWYWSSCCLGLEQHDPDNISVTFSFPIHSRTFNITAIMNVDKNSSVLYLKVVLTTKVRGAESDQNNSKPKHES